MSIYKILPALVLTQSVHAKISIGMHRVVKFKISRIPLIGLEMRLGWRTDRKFLRNPNLNEIVCHRVSNLETVGNDSTRGVTSNWSVSEMLSFVWLIITFNWIIFIYSLVIINLTWTFLPLPCLNRKSSLGLSCLR